MNRVTQTSLPAWVSDEVFRYLEHTVAQVSIRELSRNAQCHASTVLRQVRRLEQLREDPLVDGALTRLSDVFYEEGERSGPRPNNTLFSECDAARCLTMLTQSGAVLVAGRNLPKVIIVRGVQEDIHKTVVDRHLAEILALLDWISCFSAGRVHRYRISKDGRSALATMMAAAENKKRIRAETTTQSGISGVLAGADGGDDLVQKRARYGPQETPIQTLARLSDRQGKPFLTVEMLRAGERLREDFELAQIGQHIAEERAVFAEGGCRSEARDYDRPARQAFQRSADALCALGPGLSDIALRCCCHLEGLEAAERELGWSARSGKIVLRIALEQLHQYYESLPPQNQMIG
ncbi:DUF6456 domain-containing protein [Phaeobacter sp. B1627]|uniref:DUF6456 domain-containing protein n=1 Tax=Phaeobacter sp. B1627 TaxID=2583809 RepID=UPI00111ADAC5|nr:DUF6456 domain-containing protein [Phaeobacter sp. B1627]TNJ41607.1 hypothetical protein FGE21_13565 [Phaeobacter sp. B1627]